ncbi:MAG: WbqC family protein [Cytophagales bacterium]|nr:WbqC family protein [Cytophagales bacterium]
MQILIESQYLSPWKVYSEFINADTICIEQCENYQKQTYRNRCYIAGANGILPLIVPVQHGNSKYIKDIKIEYAQRWQQVHLRGIKSCYGKAPFFEYHYSKFEEIYMTKTPFLIDLNQKFMTLCLEILKLKKKITHSKLYELRVFEKNIQDIRNKYLPDTHFPALIPKIDGIYYQPHVQSFASNLSVLDLIFNEGTNAMNIMYNNEQN